MAKRVYQSLKALYLSTYVNVGGKWVSVKFTGGTMTPKRVNGKLSTSDPGVQKALEENVSYGVKWTRIEPPHGAKIKEQAESVKTPKTAEAEPQAPPPEENPLVEVSGVTGAQQAREYLLDNYEGIAFSEVKSTDKIREMAKKLNVTFPDWT